MDFMTHLPESKGFGSIMVVVDRVSKMTHFVPTQDTVVNPPFYSTFKSALKSKNNNNRERVLTYLTSYCFHLSLVCDSSIVIRML